MALADGSEIQTVLGRFRVVGPDLSNASSKESDVAFAGFAADVDVTSLGPE